MQDKINPSDLLREAVVISLFLGIKADKEGLTATEKMLSDRVEREIIKLAEKREANKVIGQLD